MQATLVVADGVDLGGHDRGGVGLIAADLGRLPGEPSASSRRPPRYARAPRWNSASTASPVARSAPANAALRSSASSAASISRASSEARTASSLAPRNWQSARRANWRPHRTPTPFPRSGQGLQSPDSQVPPPESYPASGVATAQADSASSLNASQQVGRLLERHLCQQARPGWPAGPPRRAPARPGGRGPAPHPPGPPCSSTPDMMASAERGQRWEVGKLPRARTPPTACRDQWSPIWRWESPFRSVRRSAARGPSSSRSTSQAAREPHSASSSTSSISAQPQHAVQRCTTGKSAYRRGHPVWASSPLSCGFASVRAPSSAPRLPGGQSQRLSTPSCGRGCR